MAGAPARISRICRDAAGGIQSMPATLFQECNGGVSLAAFINTMSSTPARIQLIVCVSVAPK
jgi:hypothetical protein